MKENVVVLKGYDKGEYIGKLFLLVPDGISRETAIADAKESMKPFVLEESDEKDE